jgi:fatty-acyl-CoA synthase
MKGLMMQQPLLVSTLLTHAERHHGDQEIVSKRVEGDVHRYRFADLARRSRRLANALATLGVQAGDRVGTLAWNGYRHLELYYAVSGSGAVLHTINPRLHFDQIAYMIRHAEDRVIFFDLDFLPLVQALAEDLPKTGIFVAMTDRTRMASCNAKPAAVLCYEELLEAQGDHYAWPLFDENDASSLCYTSDTTGNPKGVLYSHRSTVLHTFAVAMPDAFNCSAWDTILPAVPMFDMNAWGLPYAACMVGAKLVLPGPWLKGESLYELIESEGVTMSAGVPSVWQGLLEYVNEHQRSFSSMRRTVIGGAQCPPAMIAEFQEVHCVDVLHAWGMTELSPLGTVGTLKPQHVALSPSARMAIQARQGRAVFGIDMKIVDDDGNELPWDNTSKGELMVRGPWVADGYFRDADNPPQADGWLPTGDIATIDSGGFMQITDYAKDVIKSGDELISSIDIEYVASLHPDVVTAVCIAARHLKWGERPLLLIVKEPGSKMTADELSAFFIERVATWSIPEAVVFVDAFPLGPTGKILKDRLREQFRDFLMKI